ncbi:hypothetical protein HMPREF1872_01418 [Amygdalobacter nucleatus]|uniref:Uncharacterized protein n=1 Tax=Amygdalobacter nucleatus TaxID=3029274 RepID=A0A133Y6W0_9FIRM|nr:hypothetical protein HMPREF1872_01418 [Amygdalobacter nucleatus]
MKATKICAFFCVIKQFELAKPHYLLKTYATCTTYFSTLTS